MINNMKILNASDAKREFGEVLIRAQHGPIGINRNGKPVAVMLSVSEYTQLVELRRLHLKQSIEEGLADLRAEKITEGKSVLNKLRKRINS
jgi:prevent-host-death family protein